MVVSQNIESSKIGAQILGAGGNAVDAAVAVGFSLATTLPRAGNLGGGGFMLIYIKDKKELFSIDYRSRSSLNSNLEDLFGSKLPQQIQDSDYDFLFVRALKSGAEIREGESPYLALLEAGVNQATDLAIADFNSRQAFYDGMNQSLLTAFKGEGEMFKGKVMAQAEMIKGIAQAGGNYASTGSLLG